MESYEEIDLMTEDPHDVAAVLRIFMRELPEPVIPFALYDPLIAVQRKLHLLCSAETYFRSLVLTWHIVIPFNL